MPEVRLAEPIPLRLLVDDAVRLARPRFWTLLRSVALPVGLTAGFLPLAQLQWMSGMMRTRTPDFAAMVPGLIGFGSAFVLYITVLTLANAALLAAAVDVVGGREPDMGRAWKTVLQPSVVATGLLQYLGIGLGSLLCLVPGIYLGLVWGMVLPVMVAEGLRGPAALGRSRALMTHNPQRRLETDPRAKLFVVGVMGGLLSYMVGVFVQLPVMVVQQIVMFRQIGNAGPSPDPAALMASLAWIQVPGAVAQAVGHMAGAVFVTFAFARLFEDLRGRREGKDLEDAIDALASRAAPAPA